MTTLSEDSFKNVLDQGLISPISRESGQGMIEFVLVLLLTLTVVGGAVYQFGTAFGSFSEDYFGGYLSCLLETGELPTLGNENGTAAGECDAEFKAFSIANGRPPKNSGGGEASSSRRPNIRVAGQRGPSGNSFRRSRPQSNADTSGSGSPANQGVGTSPKAGGRKPVGTGEYVVGRGATAARAKQKGRQRVNSSRIVQRGGGTRSPRINEVPKKSGSSVGSLRKKRMVQTIKKVKPEDLVINAGWSISKIMRYLAMLLIFLLILFVVGFQAMQIKKGMDAE